MNDKNTLAKLFAIPTHRQPLVVNSSLLNPNTTGAWLTRFRASSVEQARGSTMPAIDALDTALNELAPLAVIQSAFLTACTVIESNLMKVENANLLNAYQIARARESINDLFEESRTAFFRVDRTTAQAVALPEYSSMYRSAQLRMSAMYEYMEVVTSSITNSTSNFEAPPNKNSVQFPTGGSL